MEEFHRKIHLEVRAEDAYAWHTRPGAFQRLTPPWERVELLDSQGSFDERRVVLAMRMGPWRKLWVARHRDVQPGRSFRDVQESGPFAHWSHEHRFEPESQRSSWLVDRVHYRLPGGSVGRALGSRAVRAKLQALFAYRHRVTADDLAAFAAAAMGEAPTTILITGASGLIGSALRSFLEAGGHGVRTLGRNPADASGMSWDPARGRLEAGVFEGIDAVVHLAGANVGQRWTAAHKRAIRESRVDGTRLLCERLASLPHPPRTLVSASAIGTYGDRGDVLLDEGATRGEGFLPDVSREWEAATEPARARGVRVVLLRLGIVLDPRGGALARMLLPFRLGMGGPLGAGRQFMSWVALDDVLGIVYRALYDSSLAGPVNAVAPQPLRNVEFTRILAAVLGRPARFPIPAPVIRALFGEMGQSLLLESTRVHPGRLLEKGYAFRFPELEGALRHLLGRFGTS